MDLVAELNRGEQAVSRKKCLGKNARKHNSLQLRISKVMGLKGQKTD